MANTVGGWIIREPIPGAVPEKIAEGFEQAVKGIVGAGYTPLFYVGSQLVHGTNHAVVSKATPVYPDAISALVTVYLHETLDGAFSLVSVRPIELSLF
jgi:hypothetical protein